MERLNMTNRKRTFRVFEKIGNFSLNFTFKFVEEVTWNARSANPVNATEIYVPENCNINFSAKEKIIATTSIHVGSKLVQSHIFGGIAGATQIYSFK